MKKTIVGFLAAAFFAPAALFADVNDWSSGGFSIAELIKFSNSTTLTIQERIGALQEAVKVLMHQIAQIQPGTTTNSPSTCFVPTHDLYIGKTDAQTNGEVKRLQFWLKVEGYFPDAQGTGYYGMQTADAVMRWQKAHGMDFVTLTSGVGKMTRAKMQEKCSDSVQTPAQGATIASFSGPKNLGVNALGTWSVVAHDSKGEPVRYIVQWGDETFAGDIAHPANRVAFGGASEYSGPSFTHAYARAGTYTIKLSLFNPDLTRESRATIQVTVGADCPMYSSPPVVSSITPASGPVGTKIELQGCNFLGFESDKNIWIENFQGVRGIIYGERNASNTTLKATIASPLCTNDNSYSGLPCQSYLTLVPGVYSIYSSSYGGNSNIMNFTVTAQ